MATPFFCSDCDAELKPGEAVRKKDGRVICAKCERKIREKAEAKRQPDLFVEQQGLFNPSRVRNVPGFKDQHGQFHPIRAGKGYNEFLAGDFEPRKLTAKQEAAQKEWERQELEQIRKDVQPKRSLAQFVRASGGIVPGGMYAGEIRRLGFHETGTTGLINQKARQGSQKQTAEYVMDAANAEGYRDRNGEPFTEIGAFLQAVESSAVKGIDKFGKKADSAKTRRAKRLAKAMRNPKPTVSDKISQLRHEGYPQRQAVAVALEEQRAGKVRNGLLSNYRMIKAHDRALIEAAKQRTSLEVIEEQIREIRYDPWYNKPANAASRRIALARLTDRKKDLLAKMKRKNPQSEFVVEWWKWPNKKPAGQKYFSDLSSAMSFADKKQDSADPVIVFKWSKDRWVRVAGQQPPGWTGINPQHRRNPGDVHIDAGHVTIVKGKSTVNPSLVAEDAEKARTSIDAPYVGAQYSRLGGAGRESVLIVASLDPRESWKNGILENSRYTRFHLGSDGVLEQFTRSRGLTTFRKTRVKDIGEAVAKINKYLSQQTKSNPHKSYYGLATKTTQARTKVIAKANAYYRQADKLEKAGKPIQARAAAAKGNALLKRFHASGKYSEGPIGRLPNISDKKMSDAAQKIHEKLYELREQSSKLVGLPADDIRVLVWKHKKHKLQERLKRIQIRHAKRNPRQKSEADTLGVRHPVENPAKAPRGSSEKHWLVTADVSGKYDAYPKYESAQILAVNKTQALKAARPQLLAKYPSARRFEVAGPFHDRLSASYAIKAEKASIARHKRKHNPGDYRIETLNTTDPNAKWHFVTERTTGRTAEFVTYEAALKAARKIRKQSRQYEIRIFPYKGAGTIKHFKATLKKNPSVKELSERFNGNASGAIHTGKAANGAPSNLSRAGKLVFLKVAGKTLRIPGATVAIAPNEKLWIVSESSPVFQRRAPKGQALDYGEVQAICYDTAKSHIGGGKRYEYEHAFGENGGKKPHLLVDDEGMPILRGGDYKIRAEGIVN